MLSLSRPLDAMAIALAVALGVLAFTQWRESSQFSADAVATTGRVVEVRTAKKVLLDAQAEVFATVEFRVEDGATVRSEIPTSVHRLGIERHGLEGRVLPISYDPASPMRVRYGQSPGSESALVLLLLAVGALFAPTALRSSALRKMATPGGG
ncbi:MAG: DUF3592 domain-containing protein [Planctomycetota bacterium]